MNMHKNLQPKLLSLSVAAILGMNTSQLLAQEATPADDTEVIMVKGIRSSMIKAMDIKRSSDGVVDAISAEDIGKFPDTNLAESLQRITGVSIDRVNGEGSRVTVRGFGPDFNLVTLNGRQMPAANLGATAPSSSRSYDFANLAAESVSGVEVYKTGKANITTGGIGSTININTVRPLALGEEHASVGIKAVADSSNRVGNDITPEVSGIYSNTFNDNTFGVALTASYQERDSGYNAAEVSSGWNAGNGGSGAPQQLDNPPQEGDIFAVPQNFMYSFNDVQRKRTNAQLTMQWKPVESLTTTMDYTYSDLDIEQQRQELSVWFFSPVEGGSFTQSDGSGVVAPNVYTDNSCCDVGLGAGAWGTDTESNSVGLNLDWQASDNLSLRLDYHNSSAEAGKKDNRGTNNVITATAFIRQPGQSTVDFSKDFPTLDLQTNAPLEPSVIAASGISYRDTYQKTDIEQIHVDGSYVFDDSALRSIDFGIAFTDIDNQSSGVNANGGNWGGYGAPEDFPDSIFTEKDLAGEFDNISGSGVVDHYIDVDFNDMVDAVTAFQKANNISTPFGDSCGFSLCVADDFDTDRRMQEKQQSVYVQGNFEFELGDMYAKLVLGLRYEKTEVNAQALVPDWVGVYWPTDNELQLIQGPDATYTDGQGSYNHLLPNVDFSIEVTEDVVLRASYSKTITRPSYSDVQGGTTVGNQPRADGSASVGASGNTDLDPFESSNYDLSAEWYYEQGSYFSLGYYKKDVKNFIGNASVQSNIFNLPNPVSGSRYQEALTTVTDPSNAIAQIKDYYKGQGWLADDGTLLGDTSVYDDISFTLTIPVNEKEASIDGFEVALQHMFGESGFGGIVNLTTVDGDISYDNTVFGVNQFALLGLSDSANLVAFYDKDGFQARIAYNWRDDFLSATQQGNGQQEPQYTDAYGQWDMSISYAINEQLTVMFEGINITDEDTRIRGRHENMLVFASETGPRYNLGVRYDF